MLLDNERKSLPVISIRRDWSKYSKEKLLTELGKIDMDWSIPDVQSNWNKIEDILANRMTALNNQINLDWLNLSLITFKLKVKSLFLSN